MPIGKQYAIFVPFLEGLWLLPLGMPFFQELLFQIEKSISHFRK
jgi:hypothetical protein